jgi:hypothetical protein
MATELNISDFYTGNTWILEFQALGSDGEPIPEITGIEWRLERKGTPILTYDLGDNVEITDGDLQEGLVTVPAAETSDLSSIVYRHFLTVSTPNETQTIIYGTITPRIGPASS